MLRLSGKVHVQGDQSGPRKGIRRRGQTSTPAMLSIPTRTKAAGVNAKALIRGIRPEDRNAMGTCTSALAPAPSRAVPSSPGSTWTGSFWRRCCVSMARCGWNRAGHLRWPWLCLARSAERQAPKPGGCIAMSDLTIGFAGVLFLLLSIVPGGLFGGIFSPTTAGGIGGFVTFVVAANPQRGLRGAPDGSLHCLRLRGLRVCYGGRVFLAECAASRQRHPDIGQCHRQAHS
jgi:hypothetical protein